MSWLARTPETEAMSLTRSACATPPTPSAASIAKPIFRICLVMFLERCEGRIEEAREPAFRVRVRERALAAVGNRRIGHLVGGDAVVGLDVDRPHDALQAHEFLALVDRDPLLAADDQVAVRQPLRDRHGDVAAQGVALLAV